MGYALSFIAGVVLTAAVFFSLNELYEEHQKREKEKEYKKTEEKIDKLMQLWRTHLENQVKLSRRILTKKEVEDIIKQISKQE